MEKMSEFPKKLKWGSTKYLKAGSLYLLKGRGGVAWFLPVEQPFSRSSIDIPIESYMLYLGETRRVITYWQFFHLGLQRKIEAANNSFAREILEVAEGT